MNNDKFILDATAGFRMMWFNKHHPNTIYLDERPECEPDIVGDFRDLKQFEDGTFRLIVFDPPHIIQDNVYGGSEIIHKYGALRAETWQSELQKGFIELWRVLANYGMLLFKWSNTHISSAEILKLAPVKPLFYQVAKVGKLKSCGDYKLKTLWFCFMKIPKSKTFADKGD